LEADENFQLSLVNNGLSYPTSSRFVANISSSRGLTNDETHHPDLCNRHHLRQRRRGHRFAVSGALSGQPPLGGVDAAIARLRTGNALPPVQQITVWQIAVWQIAPVLALK
jgi:hypothetical protein